MAKAVNSTKASWLTTDSLHCKGKSGNAKCAQRPAAAELQQLYKDIQATLNAINRLETQEWNRAKREHDKAQDDEYKADLKYTHTLEWHYAQLKTQEETLRELKARRELQANSGERKAVNARKLAQERARLKEDIENSKMQSEQINLLRTEQQRKLAAAKRESQQEFLDTVARQKQREKQEQTQTRQKQASDTATQCKGALKTAKAQHKNQLTTLSQLQALLKK